ncbi:hypothetical protein F7725_008837 [Dissostichus mawsoni]|uniref:Uncharacterized protein n=1 Tax=Dissostichus mawsoni TaxID=36200 RepID=A0A7J5Z9F2_DISMA|nr:hypothetical protein F7725_008837 [Dissostichus mawsoni]
MGRWMRKAIESTDDDMYLVGSGQAVDLHLRTRHSDPLGLLYGSRRSERIWQAFCTAAPFRSEEAEAAVGLSSMAARRCWYSERNMHSSQQRSNEATASNVGQTVRVLHVEESALHHLEDKQTNRHQHIVNMERTAVREETHRQREVHGVSYVTVRYVVAVQSLAGRLLQRREQFVPRLHGQFGSGRHASIAQPQLLHDAQQQVRLQRATNMLSSSDGNVLSTPLAVWEISQNEKLREIPKDDIMVSRVLNLVAPTTSEPAQLLQDGEEDLGLMRRKSLQRCPQYRPHPQRRHTYLLEIIPTTLFVASISSFINSSLMNSPSSPLRGGAAYFTPWLAYALGMSCFLTT